VGKGLEALVSPSRCRENANNQTLLGLYFDVDLENDTFNRNVKTECSIIQNDVEVFNGFIQLLEIKRINKGRSNNEQKIAYSVFVFDEVANFFNAMADFELTDLSFSPNITMCLTVLKLYLHGQILRAMYTHHSPNKTMFIR
jgi:hypothetical protein